MAAAAPVGTRCLSHPRTLASPPVRPHPGLVCPSVCLSGGRVCRGEWEKENPKRGQGGEGRGEEGNTQLAYRVRVSNRLFLASTRAVATASKMTRGAPHIWPLCEDKTGLYNCSLLSSRQSQGSLIQSVQIFFFFNSNNYHAHPEIIKVKHKESIYFFSK